MLALTQYFFSWLDKIIAWHKGISLAEGSAEGHICLKERIQSRYPDWTPYPETVICAAVRTQEGLVIRGHRHADCLQNLRNRGFPVEREVEQGFVSSKNRFVTREVGRRLQEVAGIPSADPGGYRGDTLFSEDLY